jgi:hypothetical protein
MKTKKLVVIFVLMALVALALPLAANAAEPNRLVIGGTLTLEEGEILDEDLTILGGNVTLEQGSSVTGNVQLLGGRLEVNGHIEGEILAAGGFLSLGSTAEVEGDVTLAGAVLDRDPGAVIGGELVSETNIPFTDTRFDAVWSPWEWWLNSIWNVFWFLGVAFALAALAVLVMMFFEKQTENMTRTVVKQPTVSGGMGCLTIVVFPLALVVMILSICLLPVALVALLLLGVVLALGWVALGYEVGRRLATLLHQDWAAPIDAGIGTFFLVVSAGLLNIIPCIGWIFTVAISALGIGAVLLSRLGTQDYAAMLEASGTAASPGQSPRAEALPSLMMDEKSGLATDQPETGSTGDDAEKPSA